jgi:hypothetical protein
MALSILYNLDATPSSLSKGLPRFALDIQNRNTLYY